MPSSQPPPTPPTHQSAANPTTDQPPTGFDRIKNEDLFEKLIKLISEIQELFKSTTTDNDGDNTTAPSAAVPAGAGALATTTSATTAVNKRQVETLVEDVRYIQKHIDDLRSSANSNRADELLHNLMDAAERRKPADFAPDSVNLKQLLHIVAKLKLWVPRKQITGSDESETAKKKRESPFVSSKEKENAAAEVVKELVGLKCYQWGMDGLLSAYQTLNDTEKLCLLCFSAFPCEVEIDKDTGIGVEKSLVIKKKILIYLWVGERFIDLHPQSKPNSKSDPNLNPNATLNLNPDLTSILNSGETQNPTPNPDPSPARNPEENLDSNPNPNPNTISSSDVGEGGNEGNPERNQVSVQHSHGQGDEKQEGKTIEEIGEQILMVLMEKGFIEPVIKKGQESGYCRMHPFVHSFVSALAKRAGFFQFSKDDGELTPVIGSSRRACLVKSQGKFLSSCQLWSNWANDTDSRLKLKKFQSIQTLFNVNESIIDIKPECFSKMKYLLVLRLGSWRSESVEHIEVEDQKFLEDLKIMQQLRLFSLQGVSTIMQLPDSVCELKNLIILDLRECHNLEELPAGIGALKNLTHIDITNCHLLTKLPKGISSLSKLEVLRGFVISDQAGDQQEKTACINRCWKKAKGCVLHDVFRFKRDEVCKLNDLLKIKRLRELSIVVNSEKFPDTEEVKVFAKMECLRKLKISWERSFKNDGKTDNTAPGDNQARSASSSQNEGENSSDAQANTAQGDNQTPEESSSICGSCLHGMKPASVSSRAVARPEMQDPNDQQAPKTSKCLDLMQCWGPSSQTDGGEKSSAKFLNHIEKLELWCFPGKTAPDWLAPEQLNGLRKLYIKGGNLETLPAVTDGNEWKVTTLRLKYLPYLKIKWTDLKAMFPKMTYLEKYSCNKLNFFPCDQEGLWRKK